MAVGLVQLVLLLVGREVYILLGPNIAFIINGRVLTIIGHLCFMQAQPKMCHSPKVDEGVDHFFLNFLNTYLLTFVFKEL